MAGSLLVVAIGVLALGASSEAGGASLRFWQALLVNWLFWTGMAMGGIVFSAILEVTGSRWGRPFKRIAELFGSFLPASLVMFVLLYFGAAKLYPWVGHPLPGKEWWLSKNFMFGRDLVAILVMYGIGLFYVHSSVKPDLTDKDSDVERYAKRRTWLAPVVIIVYALSYSLIAYDLVMSLSPTWFSTLFGAYVAVINIFGTLALLAAVSVLFGKRLGIDGAMGEPQYHDLGKLTFGFCILSMDFFWSQFLVIWYGNLPEETGFVLIRAFQAPWVELSWLVLFGGFVAPFFLLLRRRMKTQPKRLAAIGVWISAMILLERFILVAPSSWPGESLPLGAIEVVVTLASGALFFAGFFIAAKRVPTLPTSDPLLSQDGLHHHYIGEPDYMPGDARPAADGGDG